MNEQQNIERLARIETNIQSMAETLKRIADDHEKRIRLLEEIIQRVVGVLKVIGWLGAPTFATILYLLVIKP